MSTRTKPGQRDNSGRLRRENGTAHLRSILAMAAIVAVTCAVYSPALRGSFVWDDDAHVTSPELRSLHGLARIWFDVGATQQYYPLLHSAFWLEHHLWGDLPLGYHLANLIEHLAATWLVYLVLSRLEIPGAVLAAAIFALHPVQVESVAWITEQKNTLSAVFYLSAMLMYLRFDRTRRPLWYCAALGLFLLGLLSKTVTATLPAALLLIFWWQRGKLSWQRDIKPLAPFFLLGAVAGLFTAWVERALIGAEGASFDLSLVQRALLTGRVVWFYAGKLIWPANLIFIYPRWQVNPHAGWQWLFPLGALVLVVGLWAVRRRWRAPLAGWLFFVGTLFPVLGLFNVYPFVFSFVADHFQYLACLGLIALFSAGMILFMRRLPPPARWAANGLCVALVGTLAVLSWRQAQMYADVVRLYQTTIERNPACWLAYNNLGAELGRKHQPRASDYLEQALRIRPDYPDAYNNLGIVLAAANRTQEAIAHYERALQLKPDYAEAHYNLANTLAMIGRPAEAIQHYQQALRIKPAYAEVHNNLGTVLKQSGQLPEAIDHYRQAIQIDPGYFDAHYNLANALQRIGKTEEAIEHYRRAVQLMPDDIDSWRNLASAYAVMRETEKAVSAAQQALKLATAEGRTDLAAQIEAWLRQYRAGAAEPGKSPGQPASPGGAPDLP